MSMPLLPFAQTIHANYPSFLHVLMPRAAHEISPAKSVDGQCVLPPCHGNLRDLPTHKVRSSSSHTKKSVDLFCSFDLIRYLCKCGATQIRQDVSCGPIC